MDENTNPVQGVVIHLRWSEFPAEAGMRTADALSDNVGLFSLQGKRGASLTVSFRKDGYYSSGRGEETFSYALPSAFVADSYDPVIFKLRKKGAGANLIGFKQNYRVARDGTPLEIDLSTGKAVAGGSGDFVVHCWTHAQGKPAGQKNDWRCVITVFGGGMAPTDEEFAFLAPENGCALTNEIAMPADRANWMGDVDLIFYYRRANGSYGRMKFSMRQH